MYSTLNIKIFMNSKLIFVPINSCHKIKMPQNKREALHLEYIELFYVIFVNCKSTIVYSNLQCPHTDNPDNDNHWSTLNLISPKFAWNFLHHTHSHLRSLDTLASYLHKPPLLLRPPDGDAPGQSEDEVGLGAVIGGQDGLRGVIVLSSWTDYMVRLNTMTESWGME